jgi:hypothetical protein
MATEVRYKYDDLFAEARHRTEMECITMPQPGDGVPGGDVRNVVGVMEEADAVFTNATLARGAAAIYPSLRIAISPANGLIVEAAGTDKGVVFNFVDNRLGINDMVVIQVNLKTALLHFVLYEWFTMFPARADIAKKYMDLYAHAVSGIKRSIIQ